IEDGTGRLELKISDGARSTTGELISNGPGLVSLRIDTPPSSCQTLFPSFELQKLNGALFGRTGDLPFDNAGFRMGSAQKAVFFDSPSSRPKTVFVLRGDTLEQLGEDQGFARVRYTHFGDGRVTTGFLRESDLVPDAF